MMDVSLTLEMAIYVQQSTLKWYTVFFPRKLIFFEFNLLYCALLVKVHKGAETIQGRKLFAEILYVFQSLK